MIFERKKALASVCLIQEKCSFKVGYNVSGISAVAEFPDPSAKIY